MPPKKKVNIGRRTLDAKRARAYRQAETQEKRASRLEKLRSYNKWNLSQETPEERESRLSVVRARARCRLEARDRRKVKLIINRVRQRVARGSDDNVNIKETQEDPPYVNRGIHNDTQALEGKVKMEESEENGLYQEIALESNEQMKVEVQVDWLRTDLDAHSAAEAFEDSVRQEEREEDSDDQASEVTLKQEVEEEEDWLSTDTVLHSVAQALQGSVKQEGGEDCLSTDTILPSVAQALQGSVEQEERIGDCLSVDSDYP